VSSIDLRKKEKNDEYLKKIEIKFCFAFFSKSGFLQKKLLFRPHISGMVRGIELKLFSHILETIWGGYFF